MMAPSYNVGMIMSLVLVTIWPAAAKPSNFIFFQPDEMRAESLGESCLHCVSVGWSLRPSGFVISLNLIQIAACSSPCSVAPIIYRPSYSISRSAPLQAATDIPSLRHRTSTASQPRQLGSRRLMCLTQSAASLGWHSQRVGRLTWLVIGVYGPCCTNGSQTCSSISRCPAA